MGNSPSLGNASSGGYGPPRQSPGVYLRVNPQGITQTGGSGGRTSFKHPFRPSLAGDKLRLSQGLVNGIEPQMGTKKLPISGDAKNPPPYLRLDPAQIDEETQQSWACIKVTPKADDLTGSQLEAEQIQVVHQKTPFSFGGPSGVQPVALILWKNNKPVRAVEVVWFNLRYVTILPGPGRGGRKHFFL